MGQYQKRNDYSISEIEKKYTNEELLRLILFDNVRNYPPIEYDPDKICLKCGKNPISKENQLSQNRECDDCYNQLKQEVYEYIIKYKLKTPIIFEGDCILENKLYLGNIESSLLKDKLKSLGITHILMVSYFVTPIFPDDFVYENIQINDNTSENILQHLVKGLKFIDESKICYTHCQLGKSRSAAFVIAYVMYKNKIHFSEALDFVKEKRAVAFPNQGFQWQLEDFDIILFNFDYDLDKCDKFIKNYFDNKEKLLISEKEYISKRIKEEEYPDYKENELLEEEKLEE